MAPDRYDVSPSGSDSLHEAAKASPLYDYSELNLDFNPGSLYYQSNASDYLPSITIDDVKAAVSDAINREKFNNRSKHTRKSDDEGFAIDGKNGEVQLFENKDGTYTHIVEKGDTYWDVARSVLMAQKGIDDPSGVNFRDIQKMMTRLQKFNDKPTSGDDANKLAIGEEIFIPRSLGEDIEERLDEDDDESEDSEDKDDSDDEDKKHKHKDSGEEFDEDAEKTSSSQSSKSEDDELTPKQKRKLENTTNGLTQDALRIAPIDGVYNPLQPPGMEPGKVGDYEDPDTWNYDVEERTDAAEVIDPDSGLKKYRYSGQVDSGYGNHWGYFKDTPFDAEETVNKNGIITHRFINYHNSTVKMNFKDGAGNKVDDYVQQVMTDLQPKTGNYKSTIIMADGTKYEMMLSGRNGQVIDGSITRLNGG